MLNDEIEKLNQQKKNTLKNMDIDLG